MCRDARIKSIINSTAYHLKMVSLRRKTGRNLPNYDPKTGKPVYRCKAVRDCLERIV